MTTVEAIRNRISEIGVGEPFTSTQFKALGTRASVDQALARLAELSQLSASDAVKCFGISRGC